MAEAYLNHFLGKVGAAPPPVTAGEGLRQRELALRDIRTYRADVTQSDLDVMALSAHDCRMVNERDLHGKSSKLLSSSARLAIQRNSVFCLLSENSRRYNGSVRTRITLDLYPSTFCPDPNQHVREVQNLPLPMACPTCWSVQRIPSSRVGQSKETSKKGKDSHTKVKVNKRKCKANLFVKPGKMSASLKAIDTEVRMAKELGPTLDGVRCTDTIIRAEDRNEPSADFCPKMATVNDVTGAILTGHQVASALLRLSHHARPSQAPLAVVKNGEK